MSVVKLIDAHGRFNLEAIRQLLSGLNSTTLLNSVSILGSEGKGKSTVLNAIFGTRFREAAEDRDEISRITNGVDAAVSNDILVLDVEGFDSSMRQDKPSTEEVKGERNIEDKMALFVLLTTDVIIINLMVTDCGCYLASGIKILETIFKATQQLSQEQRLKTKKRILFFVRDVVTHTPKSIEAAINKRLGEVFARAELDESGIRELIEIQIIPFPHYRYYRDAFDAKVQEVKAVLSKQRLSRDFPGVPARHVAGAFNSIWEAVLTNETMNLPDINSAMKAIKENEEVARLNEEAERQRELEAEREKQRQIQISSLIREMEARERRWKEELRRMECVLREEIMKLRCELESERQRTRAR